MALELRLIGQIAVLSDGNAKPLPASRKTRALLAYLAVTGTQHRREQLCSLLWDIPDDPKGALRWSLSKLRQAVDGDGTVRLLADRDSVRINLTGVACDYAQLQAAARSDDTSLLEAAAKFTGEFAPGIELHAGEELETWLYAIREDVRQAQIAVRRTLVAKLSGEPERALPHARRLVEADSLDEAAWLGLIQLLIESGRADEAQHQRELAMRTLKAAALPVPDALLGTIPASPTRAPAAKASRQQRIEFCTAADGTNIAFSRIGEGFALVKTANWLNHLEFEWESPIWRHILAELTRDNMLLRYDERGNGLSDWKVDDLSFDAMVQDLETVVDAAGLERFDLLGISQGCPISIAYAVKHPARVRSMVLFGGYAQGWRARGNANEIAAREAMVTLTKTGWGQDNPAFRQMFTTRFVPEATVEQVKWFNELQRVSTSPEGAARLQDALSVIDVTHLVPQVSVPTLVMHCRGDAVVPFEQGRLLARSIKGAQFVALESKNHIVLESEPAWERLVATVRVFLAQARGVMPVMPLAAGPAPTGRSRNRP